MKGIDHVFDKAMLVVGVLLLSLFWWQFPAMPSLDQQHYAAYTSSAGPGASASKWTHIRPSKAYTPRQVVRIQMRALQENDQQDSGIITVFNFSSPKNRMHIGPLKHFRLIVRDPAYRTMLNFESYKTGQLVVTDNKAYQLVVVTGRDGTEEVYLFILAKQHKGSYKGCWMTEGIARMDPTRPTSLT